MAGTALRNAITRLLNPSKKSAKIIKELGIEVKDSTGNMMPVRVDGGGFRHSY